MRTRNEEKHQKYRAAFALLKERNPLLTRTGAIARMHELSGVPVATIRYYLREPQDLRRHYSEEDVERLAVASPKELAAEAEKRGVTVTAIRSAVCRHLGRQRHSAPLMKQARLQAELLGYMDWSDGFALAAFDLTRRKVQLARKTLTQSWQLDLTLPNYLVHPATSRRIALTLPEQIRVLQDPATFIRRSAKELASRWEKIKEENREDQGL